MSDLHKTLNDLSDTFIFAEIDSKEETDALEKMRKFIEDINVDDLKSTDINLRYGEEGETLITLCLYTDSRDVIDQLLKKGADIEGQDKFGLTPLQLAVISDKVSRVDYLIDKGANKQVIVKKSGTFGDGTENGWELLHIAAFENSISAARLLIREGANLDAKSGIGDTPLHVALRYFPVYDSTEMLSLLLEGGADINARSWKAKGGPTILDVACRPDSFIYDDDEEETNFTKSQYELIKWLIDQGARVGDDSFLDEETEISD